MPISENLGKFSPIFRKCFDFWILTSLKPAFFHFKEFPKKFLSFYFIRVPVQLVEIPLYSWYICCKQGINV